MELLHTVQSKYWNSYICVATYAGCPYWKPDFFLYAEQLVGGTTQYHYEIFLGPLVSQVDTDSQSAATTWSSFFYHNDPLESFLRIRSVANNTGKIRSRLFFIKRGTKFSCKSFFFFENRRKITFVNNKVQSFERYISKPLQKSYQQIY